MCQVSSGELGLVDPLADPSVDLIEGALERGVDGAEIGKCGGQARAQDAVIDAGEEQRCPESELGDAIAEAFGQAFDQVVEAQAAELIGDCALGERFWIAAGQGGKMVAQIRGAKTLRAPTRSCRLSFCPGRAQAGGALAIGRDRIIDGPECIFGEHAVVAQALNLDEPAIGRKADLAQLR